MKNQSMVNISVSTLNALKQLLFSDENGVDLSSIVKDISSGLNTNEDLTAINVGLTFKGITPEIDKTTRFDNCNEYWRTYSRCEFVSYSLILDKVQVNLTEFKRDTKTDNWEERDMGSMSYSLSEWLSMSTSPDVFIDAINKKHPIDPFTENKESAE